MGTLEKNRFVHPEVQAGEVWYSNAHIYDVPKFNFKSRRVGQVPYDIYGEVVNSEDFYPLFVSYQEVKERLERLIMNGDFLTGLYKIKLQELEEQVKFNENFLNRKGV